MYSRVEKCVYTYRYTPIGIEPIGIEPIGIELVGLYLIVNAFNSIVCITISCDERLENWFVVAVLFVAEYLSGALE